MERKRGRRGGGYLASSRGGGKSIRAKQNRSGSFIYDYLEEDHDGSRYKDLMIRKPDWRGKKGKEEKTRRGEKKRGSPNGRRANEGKSQRQGSSQQDNPQRRSGMKGRRGGGDSTPKRGAEKESQLDKGERESSQERRQEKEKGNRAQRHETCDRTGRTTDSTDDEGDGVGRNSPSGRRCGVDKSRLEKYLCPVDKKLENLHGFRIEGLRRA